jgi:hypothetical protein
MDALTVIAGAWSAISSRFRGAGVGVLPLWRSVCAATSGLLLSPAWPPVVINTN